MLNLDWINMIPVVEIQMLHKPCVGLFRVGTSEKHVLETASNPGLEGGCQIGKDTTRHEQISKNQSRKEVTT